MLLIYIARKCPINIRRKHHESRVLLWIFECSLTKVVFSRMDHKLWPEMKDSEVKWGYIMNKGLRHGISKCGLQLPVGS
jgi:hypothetical protein